MKQQLRLSQILEFYDTPVLFVATDELDTSYLCLLVSDDVEAQPYIAVGVSKSRLSKFLGGQVDLREIFAQPEKKEWLGFAFDDAVITPSVIDVDNLEDRFLPDEGYFYGEDDFQNDFIIEEAMLNNKPVIHLSISDSLNSHSIPAKDLSSVLVLYQMFVEYALKKSVKRAQRPRNFDSTTALRVFDSSRGSFNIHLYSNVQLDLFGNSVLDFPLQKFDEIVNDFDHEPTIDAVSGLPGEDNYLSSLRQIKGHAISSYTKLLRKIIDSDLTLKHKWYSPGAAEIHYSILTKSNATDIYSYLIQSMELSTEVRKFEGYFTQVDVDRGTWRLINNEDGRPYHGNADINVLKGITVNTIVYKIECEEVLEEQIVSKKETATYILMNIETIGDDLPF